MCDHLTGHPEGIYAMTTVHETTDKGSPDRLIRCRYMATGTRHEVKQCTAEVLDPEAELLLCTAHFAAAMRMAQEHRLEAIRRLGRMPARSIGGRS